MNPIFPLNNFHHSAGIYTEHNGELCACRPVCLSNPSKLFDIFCCKLGVSVVFSLCNIRMMPHVVAVSARRALPVFGNHIFDIINLRAKEKVIRINAGPIVAFVKNACSVKRIICSDYFAKVNFPTKPVGKFGFLAKTKLSIPSFCQISNPHPARPKLGPVFRNWSVFINPSPKIVFFSRIQLEKIRGFWNGLFSSLRGILHSILRGLSAISVATNNRDGVSIYAPKLEFQQG